MVTGDGATGRVVVFSVAHPQDHRFPLVAVDGSEEEREATNNHNLTFGTEPDKPRELGGSPVSVTTDWDNIP